MTPSSRHGCVLDCGKYIKLSAKSVGSFFAFGIPALKLCEVKPSLASLCTSSPPPWYRVFCLCSRTPSELFISSRKPTHPIPQCTYCTAPPTRKVRVGRPRNLDNPRASSGGVSRGGSRFPRGPSARPCSLKTEGMAKSLLGHLCPLPRLPLPLCARVRGRACVWVGVWEREREREKSAYFLFRRHFLSKSSVESAVSSQHSTREVVKFR